jgi:hypothetical protein
MAGKRKAKFRVGQVVMWRQRKGSFGRPHPCLVDRIRENGNYDVSGAHSDNGWEVTWFRLLTRRKRGE